MQIGAGSNGAAIVGDIIMKSKHFCLSL